MSREPRRASGKGEISKGGERWQRARKKQTIENRCWKRNERKAVPPNRDAGSKHDCLRLGTGKTEKSGLFWREGRYILWGLVGITGGEKGVKISMSRSAWNGK